MNEKFYFCENCKEFFERKEILIENGGLHCPHCGGQVKEAQAHVDHRGGKPDLKRDYVCPSCEALYRGNYPLTGNEKYCHKCGHPLLLIEDDKTAVRKIYKYPLPLNDEIAISMPEGSEILTVQIQGMLPYIWAIVDTDAPKTTRYLCIRGTGHIFKGNEGKYIGTFQYNDGTLVFHVFEERQK
jgi:DNA-directed RNA polymerase subunit RPC12/RpoP